MGYDETTSRNSISLNFLEDYSEESIQKVVDKIFQKIQANSNFKLKKLGENLLIFI